MTIQENTRKIYEAKGKRKHPWIASLNSHAPIQAGLISEIDETARINEERTITKTLRALE